MFSQDQEVEHMASKRSYTKPSLKKAAVTRMRHCKGG